MAIIKTEEILKIYKNMASGPYSAQATHDHVDKLMEKLIGEKNFTEDKYQLTNKQIQVMLGVMEILVERIENGEGNDEKDETDSGSVHVQTTDGNENNRLPREREGRDLNSGLDGFRSVQEVRDSSDVSNIQPERETYPGR